MRRTKSKRGTSYAPHEISSNADSRSFCAMLQVQLDAMSETVRSQAIKLADAASGIPPEVAESRAIHRAANNAVVEIDGLLGVLAGRAQFCSQVPRTGRAIRGLGGEYAGI